MVCEKDRSTFGPVFSKYLHVESYKIDDTERVGSFDFTNLKYNSDRRCISILTATPIGARGTSSMTLEMD